LSKPNLIIIAGCNGAGKSTFSPILVENIIPFDFDKRFIENYNSLIDSDVRDVMASNITVNEFETKILEAFDTRSSFCYETNFTTHPIYWVEKAKSLGYIVKLFFFCLDNLEIAKQRVYYRTLLNGHFVDDKTIAERWKEGYKNLNLFFQNFDYVLLIDNSYENKTPTFLFELFKKDQDLFEFRKFQNSLPEYTNRRMPSIFNLLSED
jgi:predicted ABC-type ATPase